ncbi:preprotein translocase subunit SecA, partial [bacterium]|nr:preprotein translocase subunit SecA [bacterium]
MIEKMIEKIFGSKHQRDIKQMEPIVREINRIYDTLKDISDEELKAKTDEFKAKIQERIKEIQEEIRSLKEKLRAVVFEEGLDYDNIRHDVEELEKEELTATEEVLEEIMPEAFAVVKETCRRLLGKSWKVV